MVYDKSIAELVKNARKEKKLSARQLAKLCDVSHTEINNIEKGVREKPALLTLKAFEKYLDLDFKELAEKVGYSEEAIEYDDDEIIVSYEKFNKKLDEFNQERRELQFKIDQKRHLGMDIRDEFEVIKEYLNSIPDLDSIISRKINNIDKLLDYLIEDNLKY